MKKERKKKRIKLVSNFMGDFSRSRSSITDQPLNNS